MPGRKDRSIELLAGPQRVYLDSFKPWAQDRKPYALCAVTCHVPMGDMGNL